MNEHTTNYLEYFINLKYPQYAVLLKGKWGCGKTYYINHLKEKWIEPNEEEDKITLQPIYVSLNGISDVSTINEKIRAEISPFMYSKGMQVAKKVLQGLLKTTAKIDLNFDDKSEGNISFNIDSMSLFDSSNNKISGKRILIFDDIERCKISTDEIFGYINHFVEHSRCNVILISDEEKLENKYEKINTSVLYK